MVIHTHKHCFHDDESLWWVFITSLLTHIYRLYVKHISFTYTQEKGMWNNFDEMQLSAYNATIEDSIFLSKDKNIIKDASVR